MRNGVVVGLGGQICVWYAYRTVLLVSSMACVQYGVCPYGVCPYGVRRLLDVAEPFRSMASSGDHLVTATEVRQLGHPVRLLQLEVRGGVEHRLLHISVLLGTVILLSVLLCSDLVH